VIKNDRIHLLRMAVEHMESLASADTPDTDSAVVRSTDQGISIGRDGADRMCVSSQNSNKVRAVRLVGWRTGLDISTRTHLGETPNSKLTVSGTGYDKGLLGLHDGLSTRIPSGFGRHQDLQATDGTSMSVKDLLTESPLNIPDTNGSIS
jgi:hypothetical protein